MSAEDLRKRVNEIWESSREEATALVDAGDLRTAKVVITDAQRELRDVKRQATHEQRQVRHEAADARLKIGGRGQTIGLVMGSKARGAMAAGRSSARRDLARRQADALRPYDELRSSIDEAVARLDRVKASVTQAIADAKSDAGSRVPRDHRDEKRRDDKRADPEAVEPAPSTAEAPPVQQAPPPPPPPPHWTRDPSGRNELRWWDGAGWREHVSNRGVLSKDPLG